MTLPLRVRELLPVQPLGARYQVLHGPHAAGEPAEGTIVKAGSSAVEVHAAAVPPPHSEVRLRIVGADGREAPWDLYGRVTVEDEGGESFLVSFTAPRPELAQLLQDAVIRERRAER
jgi:hypothetical protein